MSARKIKQQKSEIAKSFGNTNIFAQKVSPHQDLQKQKRNLFMMSNIADDYNDNDEESDDEQIDHVRHNLSF